MTLLTRAMAIAALATVAAAAPAAGKIKTTEIPIDSRADSADVLESLVRVHDPLPEELDAPRACDHIEYLRFRHADGPKKARKADAVMVIIPGFLGGATNFDQLARNTVEAAAKKGKHVEYWALDRRSNCLEDDRGIRAAARAEDYSVAYDYYWGGEPVNGKTFEGFATETEAGFLSSFGLERTLRDWYTVLRSGIRGQRRRERKVVCGGHSLGGPLTAAFSSWDFDGDPETTKDAGYSQCAGLVGLDTTLELSGSTSGASAIGPPARPRRSKRHRAVRERPAAHPGDDPGPDRVRRRRVLRSGRHGHDHRAARTRRTSTSPSAPSSAATRSISRPGCRTSASSRSRTSSRSAVSSTTTRRRSRSCDRAWASSRAGRSSTRTSPRRTARSRWSRTRPTRCTYEWQSYDEVGPPDNPLELNDGGPAVHLARKRGHGHPRAGTDPVGGARELHRAVLPA